jgi:hypothetical protein
VFQYYPSRVKQERRSILPWSKDKTIPALENKPDKVKEVFAEAANAALSRGLSEEDAVFAGLGAVSRYEKANKPLKKSLKPELPIHVKVILEAKKQKEQEELENLKKAALELEEKRKVESPKVLKAFLPENAIEPNPERSLVAAEWDKQGRLILTFDDGEKITTSPVPVQEKIEQYIGVSYGRKLDGIDNIQITNPQDGQILKYDASTQTWKNVNPVAASVITTASYFTKVNTTANVPLVINHGMNLIDQDAFTFNAMLAGEMVEVGVTSLTNDSIAVVTSVPTTNLCLTIVGVIA